MWGDDALDDSMGRDQGGADAGERCVVNTRFVPSSSRRVRQRMQEQVYYLHCRDRHDAEDEERDLFTAAETGATRADARGLLWDNRCAKDICFHRMILSPSRGLGITTTEEAQAWTRSVMEGLGRQIDRDLSWVAAVHRNTGRTHVHVLVAGEGATPSMGGERRVVRFGPRDLKALRERIALDAARPIRSAAQVRARTTARAAQDVQRTALYERLGVPLVEVVTQSPTTPAVSADTAEAHAVRLATEEQAGRKRHWWQRGVGG